MNKKKLLVFTIICFFIGINVAQNGLTNNMKADKITSLISNRSFDFAKESEELMNLPRTREGGTPYNPDQLLYPRSINLQLFGDTPTSGSIKSPPEYGPTQGVLYAFTSSYQSAVVTDLVVELTEDDEHDEIAYVWVSSVSQQNIAINYFSNGGANMSKVEFIIGPMNSIWLRDYGPHFIWQNDTIGIVDSHYYQSRSLDNFIPTLLGDDFFNIPTHDMGLMYSGGNFQPGPDGSGFVTELVNSDNPSSQGFNESFIAELYQTYQGISTLHIMPQLPPSVDGTGHIDMWMNIVDEDTVIISRFKPGSNPTAITITENAVTYMEGLGFEVYRTPAWNVGGTHYTYTNAFRVNDRYFTSYYAAGNPNYADEDAEAYANFSLAAGVDVEIIPIDCYNIIPAAGAIHCIVMQVPRRIDPTPAVHVLWPDGGEILVSGTTQKILWEATDTYNEECNQIDLYYSTNDGSSYTFIDTTSDTGSYDWVVPDLYSDQMKIKVVATANDLDQGEAESTAMFTVASGTQYFYNFSTGAGVDKFGWGSSTSSWNGNVDGVRMPVTTEIDTLVTDAYQKIAYSDATGSDGDTNRYISPNPSYYYESTHIFEFTINEDISEIDIIDFLWEGYGDSCVQMELYIWDYIEDQWCDGTGLYGQNRYMDCWTGNRDGYLEKQIINNFDHFIDGNQKLTLLLYTEKGPNSYSPFVPSFHDYLSITVSSIQTGPILSYSPESHDFNVIPTDETEYVLFNIWNDGSGILSYNIVETCDWLSVSPISGDSSGEQDEINITVNTAGLSEGSYSYDITINSDGGSGLFRVDMIVYNGDYIDLSLITGWNLITIPSQTGWWASDVADNLTGCTSISGWDNIAQTYDTYIVGGPPTFDFEIQDGYGYFVDMTQSDSLIIIGTSIASVSIPLKIGWNLIGWYHDYDTTAISLSENITGATSVSRWNASLQTYDTYIVGGPPTFDFTITGGMGLFIDVTQESVWNGEG